MAAWVYRLSRRHTSTSAKRMYTYVDNVEIQMENKYFPRFPFADGANFGDFTLLFCRGRLRNICILRRTC